MDQNKKIDGDNKREGKEESKCDKMLTFEDSG